MLAVLGSLLLGWVVWLVWLTVPFGLVQGGWLLLRRGRPLLAAASVLGAGMVVLGHVRQYRLDAQVDASGGTGGWDPAFLPLCLLGVAVVAVVLRAATAGPRVRTA